MLNEFRVDLIITLDNETMTQFVGYFFVFANIPGHLQVALPLLFAKIKSVLDTKYVCFPKRFVRVTGFVFLNTKQKWFPSILNSVKNALTLTYL